MRVYDFIIDEADDSYDAFVGARALGYRGISSKSCKGIYKSVSTRPAPPNGARGSENFFVTGEDLTCQAGLAVQQDLALGALIGVTHAERNGHHYVDGFADAPADGSRMPSLPRIPISMRATAIIRLAIHDGDLLTASLTSPGFATCAHPLWSTMSPLQQPKARTLQEQSI